MIKLFSAGMLLGVTVLFHLSFLPGVKWFSAALLTFVFFTLSFRNFAKQNIRNLSQLISGVLFAWILVLIYAQYFFPEPPSQEWLYKPVVITGTIEQLPEEQERMTNFYFNTHSINQRGSLIRLSWYGAWHELKPGDQWQLRVKLRPIHGLSNPAGFDYEAWALEKHIASEGYVVQSPDNKLLGSYPYATPLSSLRYQLFRKVYSLTKNLSEQRFLLALTLGDRSQLVFSDWQTFQNTGTNHLVVIAGLHVGLLAMLVFLGVRSCVYLFPRLLLVMTRSQWSALGSLLAACIYSGMAGFSVPTQRALLMLSIVYLATLTRRHMSSGQGFCLALTLVLLFDPAAVLSMSFWLSFYAVFIIIFLISGRRQCSNFFLEISYLQIGLAIGLIPLSFWFFNQAALTSPIANAIAIPLVGCGVVPLSLLGCLFSYMNASCAYGFFWLANKIMFFAWLCLEKLANLQWASSYHEITEGWLLALAILAIILFLAPRSFPKKWLCGFLLIPLVFLPKISLAYKQIQLTLLDVGQGLSVVIRTAHHALLYDAGPTSLTGNDIAQEVIIPSLSQLRTPHINRMIISHTDADHRGGVPTLLKRNPDISFLTSNPRFFKQQAKMCHGGQSWQWDGVDFMMLAPDQVDSSDTNDSSCVLSISVGGQRILLTGDIEKKEEENLVRAQAQQLPSIILVAPHHGSKSSSSEPFVEAVHPHYVLYPTGFHNRFRFPHTIVDKRYAAIHAIRFNTAIDGAIQITLSEQGVINPPILYRKINQRWWRQKIGYPRK